MGGVNGRKDYITFDELRELGCPENLLMRYLGWTREEVMALIKHHADKK